MNKRHVILLEDLIEVFMEELGHILEEVEPPDQGRPPVYPAEALFLSWLFLYLGVADSQRRLIDFPTQRPEWIERLGFEERAPDQSTFSWFKNHRARHVFPRVSDEAVQRLVEIGVIKGNHVVVDASLFHAYSNPRKKDEVGALSDPDASGGFESSTGQCVYGYKLHVVSCADAELPLALTVTTGKRGDSPLFPQLLRKASDFPTSMRVIVADGNYHSAKNHLEAYWLVMEDQYTFDDAFLENYHMSFMTCSKPRLFRVSGKGFPVFTSHPMSV